MATVKLWTDEEAAAVPRVSDVFEDIRATRKSDFVNNFWRALANQPALLERTWASVKEVMITPGSLDPSTNASPGQQKTPPPSSCPHDTVPPVWDSKQ